jgi:hypothetical protein
MMPTLVYNQRTRKCNGRALFAFFINRQKLAEWSILMQKQATWVFCVKLGKKCRQVLSVAYGLARSLCRLA